METPRGVRKPTEIFVTEFCFFEELKNVKITLLSNTRTVQIAKFPEISHFFLLISQLSRPSYKCRVTQKLRNSSIVYHKTENPGIRSKNLRKYLFLAALIHHESKLSGGPMVL